MITTTDVSLGYIGHIGYLAQLENFHPCHAGFWPRPSLALPLTVSSTFCFYFTVKLSFFLSYSSQRLHLNALMHCQYSDVPIYVTQSNSYKYKMSSMSSGLEIKFPKNFLPFCLPLYTVSPTVFLNS